MAPMAELPTLKDFSRASINKAVLKEALTHPASLLPAVLTVLCGLSGALFSSPLLLGASAGIFLAGAGGFIVNYCFRYESIGRNYIESLSQSFIDQKASLIDGLQSDLSDCMGIDEERCRQGIDQFSAAKQKYNDVKQLLSVKLSDTELLHDRFLGSVESVYLSVLDNLREIIGIMQGLPDDEEATIRAGKPKAGKPDEVEQRKMTAILKRQELRLAQLKKIDELLAKNEEALTQLEEASVTISSMRTQGRLSDTDSEESILRLKEIAQKAKTIYGEDPNVKQ
jgi:hypothetical protein